MKRKRSEQKGFSLAELVVASGIVAGMTLVLATVLQTGVRGWQVGQGQMTTSFELRRGIHSMARELAQTRNDQLWRPGAGGAWVPWTADGVFYNSVRFRVPEVVAPNSTVLDAAGAVTWSPNLITCDLGGVNGQELRRTQTGAPVSPLALAYGVTALSFRRLAGTPSVLQINVTVQRGAATPGAPTSGEAQPVTLSTRIRLRN